MLPLVFFRLEKVLKKLALTFKETSLGTNVTMVPLSCNTEKDNDSLVIMKEKLQMCISNQLSQIKCSRQKSEKQDFLFAVDHCFQIKGESVRLRMHSLINRNGRF